MNRMSHFHIYFKIVKLKYWLVRYLKLFLRFSNGIYLCQQRLFRYIHVENIFFGLHPIISRISAVINAILIKRMPYSVYSSIGRFFSKLPLFNGFFIKKPGHKQSEEGNENVCLVSPLYSISPLIVF